MKNYLLETSEVGFICANLLFNAALSPVSMSTHLLPIPPFSSYHFICYY